MFFLLLMVLFSQPPSASEPVITDGKAESRPSITRFLPLLKDLQPEQKKEIQKLQEEYAALIGELEKERDSKLAAVLNREQRDELARLLAEETDRYRVVLRARVNRPQQLFKPLKDTRGLAPAAARTRIEQTPNKPLAEDLPKAKADALLKAVNAAGAKAVLEKQE